MIDITRLFGSTFNAKASRNPLAWMLGHKLWYRSWHQVPAASLPDDDDELCYLAELGFDRVTWDSARELAMHGWERCSDGRLYHPVVAEAAREAWDRKLKKRHGSLCAAIRKHNERHPEGKIETPDFEQWQALGRPERVTDMSRVTGGKRSRGRHAENSSKGQGQGQGQGQGHSYNSPTGGAAKRGTRIDADFAMAPDWLAWATGRGPKDGNLTQQAAELQFAMFVDHFAAISGKAGVKLDWFGTWRNWCRRAPDFERRKPQARDREYLGI
ncbi:YdaU family protein [Sphingomonas nostoxanthinifaciens]|uniref:YdaU family protein n=1 Tax=Sphingomonas nostoxanthinifaciens TaxID=2872652 RepID=UPI001CC203C0|nr:YdaU family protein [Sphingomonas nostoxanthinifaciens]UAK25849.1 YdaU family protein [Sphingomonas nostoxanthinifaciens]